jgi:hypothetical protein
LRTVDKKVVMIVFRPKQEHENEDNCIIRSLTVLTVYFILRSNELQKNEEWSIWTSGNKKFVHSWLENFKERKH